MKLGVGIAAVAALVGGSGNPNPPRVITRPASDIGTETATLHGVVLPHKASATYWFVYGPSEKYGSKTPEENIGPGKKAVKVSAAVKGLTPETNYHFRVVVSNGKRTVRGRDRTFSTMPGGVGGEEAIAKWSLQTTPNPGGFGNNFETVSCLSATECIGAGESNGPMAERWDGSAWSLMSTPAAWVEIDSVSCTAFTACTAVGHTEASSYVMRLAGEEWTTQESPNLSGASWTYLHGVSCVSATFCMAVGDSHTSGEGYAPISEIWDGSEWKIQEMPGGFLAYLYDVSCTSPTACTAVGYPAGHVMRWNGGEWKAQAVPGAPGGTLNSVSCLSSASCLAVGSSVSSDETFATIWNGTEWQGLEAQDPVGSVRAELDGVSCASGSACMAVGWFETEPGTGTAYTLAEAWNGSGWEIKQTPNPPESVSSGLQDVSCVGLLVCEAVGRYNAGPILGFAERYE